MRKINYTIFTVVFLFLSSSLFSQINMYMKAIDNTGTILDGGSTTPGHLKEIEMLAWSNGMSQACSIGGGTCNPLLQDYAFTVYYSAAIIKAKQMLLSGLQLQSVDIAFRKGTQTFDFLKIHMENVIIASVSEGGSGGEDKFLVNLSFTPAKIAWQFTATKSDGTSGPKTSTGYDVLAHTIWNYY